MKYFVISDIHSFYTEMMTSLLSNGFDAENPYHKVIICGDAFDRGDETIKMFEWLKEMKSKDKLIYIRGNHEDLLEDVFRRNRISSVDVSNGTYLTIKSLAQEQRGHVIDDFDAMSNINTLLSDAYKTGILQFLGETCIDYYETKNYIFVHGFIPTKYDDLTKTSIIIPSWRKNTTQRDWASSRWTNGLSMAIDCGLREPDKTIIVGHYHTSYGHVRDFYGKDYSKVYLRSLEFEPNADFSIWKGNGIIALDGCVTLTHKVNCLVLEE